MNYTEEQNDSLERIILVTLLHRNMRIDANRKFAGMRRPSKLTRGVLDHIEELRLKQVQRKNNGSC